MKKLEQKLEGWLVKKAPYQLPDATRKALADFLPWLAVALGAFTLLLAGDIYRLVSQVAGPFGLEGDYSGIMAPGGFWGAAWVSLFLLLAQAVMLIFSFPGLKAHKKSGWNLLFGVIVVNFAYNITSYGFYYLQLGALFYSLAGTVLALYVLFQVREYFTGPRTSANPAKTPAVSPKR